MKIKKGAVQICLLVAVLLQAFNSAAQPATTIATGGNHSLFLKSDGSLWAMGWNQLGQLGDGIYNSAYPNYGTNIPVLIVSSNVTKIAGNYWHSLFIKNDGSLWAMGDNQEGELGDGTYNRTNLPEQIVASNVTAVAAGGFQPNIFCYSLFIKSDGSLWGMGYNGYGELGDGTYNSTNFPEQIVASNVTAVATGGYHSLFLKTDGSLWGMGSNQHGELGDGDYNSFNNIPILIVSNGVTAISAGLDFSLFLKNDGSVWGMGTNLYGQLGTSVNLKTNLPVLIWTNNIIAISAGLGHDMFLKSDGSLWTMGNDIFGQLGDGIPVIPFTSKTNRPEQIVSSGVTTIAAGAEHSMFIKNDGSLWVMGVNGEGQLGDGTFNNTNRPEQILAAYNQISTHPLASGNIQFAFVGIAGANYALDRSSSLAPANWVPQATNPANFIGALNFTNTPDPATNNFWRIRAVPSN
jgi:hypothetical protein